MLLPNDEQCAAIIKEMLDFPAKQLTHFEFDFIKNNATRKSFTDPQKEKVIVPFIEKFELKCMKGYKL